MHHGDSPIAEACILPRYMLTDQLKAETRELHRLMESANPLPNSKAEYLAQLVAFYGLVAPWEERLALALPETDPIRRGRAKTAWLEADLEFLGYDAAHRSRLPRASALPSTSSRPEILGAAYVLDGSTLGGQIIALHLRQTLQLGDTDGCRFFNSYGDNVGAQWQAFRVELLRASSPANDPIVVNAAQNTFGLLHDWFAREKSSR